MGFIVSMLKANVLYSAKVSDIYNICSFDFPTLIAEKFEISLFKIHFVFLQVIISLNNMLTP